MNSLHQKETFSLLKELSEKLPKFPDGRIDYTHSSFAPVLKIYVIYQDNFLIFKRSNQVLTYKNNWNTIAGYLDELKPLKNKALAELKEEANLLPEHIQEIKLGEPYSYLDHAGKRCTPFSASQKSTDFCDKKRTWLIHPVLVELKTLPQIRLDWEHTEYAWVKSEGLVSSLPSVIFKKVEKELELRNKLLK